MYLQVRRDAFRTQPALVDRKVIARFDANDVILLDQQIHPALHSTIWAVRRHNPINHPIGVPAPVGRVVKVGSIRLDDLIQIFDSTHSLNPQSAIL